MIMEVSLRDSDRVSAEINNQPTSRFSTNKQFATALIVTIATGILVSILLGHYVTPTSGYISECAFGAVALAIGICLYKNRKVTKHIPPASLPTHLLWKQFPQNSNSNGHQEADVKTKDSGDLISTVSTLFSQMAAQSGPILYDHSTILSTNPPERQTGKSVDDCPLPTAEDPCAFFTRVECPNSDEEPQPTYQTIMCKVKDIPYPPFNNPVIDIEGNYKYLRLSIGLDEDSKEIRCDCLIKEIRPGSEKYHYFSDDSEQNIQNYINGKRYKMSELAFTRKQIKIFLEWKYKPKQTLKDFEYANSVEQRRTTGLILLKHKVSDEICALARCESLYTYDPISEEAERVRRTAENREVSQILERTFYFKPLEHKAPNEETLPIDLAFFFQTAQTFDGAVGNFQLQDIGNGMNAMIIKGQDGKTITALIRPSRSAPEKFRYVPITPELGVDIAAKRIPFSTFSFTMAQIRNMMRYYNEPPEGFVLSPWFKKIMSATGLRVYKKSRESGFDEYRGFNAQGELERIENQALFRLVKVYRTPPS